MFPSVFRAFDPWHNKNIHDFDELGIKMYVSPNCKEITYSYNLRDKSTPPTQLVEVIKTESYPTWGLSFAGHKLHDPENEIIAQVFRGLNFEVKRTINQKFFPRFTGDSFYVPERMALHDIWVELQNLLDSRMLPFDAINLIEERAWKSVLDLPEIQSTGLDLSSFEKQEHLLLERYENDRLKMAQLNRLKGQLSILSRPIGTERQPFYKLVQENNSYLNPDSMPDEKLAELITQVFFGAISAYRISVEGNFPNLKHLLSTYANLPASVHIITNRKSIRYIFIPEESFEECRIHIHIPNNRNLDLENSEAEIMLKGENGVDIEFEELVHENFMQFNKTHPAIRSINRYISVEDFFSGTPMNWLSYEWLKRDFQHLIGNISKVDNVEKNPADL